jgi:hypothetical protein
LTAYGGGFASTTGNLISALNDQSGNSRNVTATGTERPTLTTLNGIPTIAFDGVNGQLYNTGVPILSLVGNNTGYMIASFRPTAFQGAGVGWQGQTVLNSNDTNAGMTVSSAGGGSFYAETWDGGGQQATANSSGKTYVGEWRHEADNYTRGSTAALK